MRRATGCHTHFLTENVISIHALHEESDLVGPEDGAREQISIHALHEESDAAMPSHGQVS